MAMSQDDLQTVADMINDSNQQLLSQIAGMLNQNNQQQTQPQPQIPQTNVNVNPQVSPYAQQGVAGLDPVTLLAVQSLQAQRNAEIIANRYTQQQQASMLGPFAALSIQDIMAFPEPTRNAVLNSIGTLMNQPVATTAQDNAIVAINERLDRMEQQNAMQAWQRAHDKSTEKKLVIGATVVVGGAAIAYGLHKVSKKRHSKEQAISSGISAASAALIQATQNK